MLDILNYSFFQNALLGILLVSIASAMIGTYIVTRRMVFITGGITHACFGGLGLGYFLSVNPIMAAGVFAIFLTPGYVPDLNSFLFGNILTISRTDIYAFAVFLAVLSVFFLLFYRQIIACAFDRDFAATKQMHVKAINCVMSVMVAICVVLTIRLIGIMLLMSLLTMPQMIAELFAERYGKMMVVSVVTSLSCAIVGLVGSYLLGMYAASVPASATIVITLIAVYFMARIMRSFAKK